ncbi:hypothetical protein NEF87_000852 [Candidatus Lokiarchaeum ossiferum]|uniref:ABC3 transporter permease C-terminal domain-containing protein n=1 Tax=Candidatus Lokiarchaeum ossiferum TaxID=2951803 RepID=A0ABY6HM34_9ARCH|nr:hypothetical protein NEF87_000852 [Candidatus Lokiarchaeum sp. B-35]
MMKTGHLNYYLSQARKTTKNAYLIIIGLGIALSMVAGVAYFSDTYTNYIIRANINELVDYSFSYYGNSHEFRNTSAETIFGFEDQITQITDAQEALKIDRYYQMSVYRSSEIYFFTNNSQNLDIYPNGASSFYGHTFNLYQVQENFYQTDSFSNFYTILDGTYPTSENEILIDVLFAQEMNLTLGKTYTIDLVGEGTNSGIFEWTQDGPELNSDLIFYNISDIKVVGIYGCLKDDNYQILGDYYDSRYLLDTKTESFEVQYNSFYDRDQSPFFTYYNISNVYGNSKFANFLVTAWNDFHVRLYRDQMLCASADYSKIDFQHISSTINEMQISNYILFDQLPMRYENYIYNQLLSVSYEIGFTRTVFQILNLPIIGFALFIGAFALKIEQKNRIEEFLLLRSKGTPQNMIRNQILVEGFFIGAIATLLGAILGIGVFFILRNILTKIFLSREIGLVLPFILTGRSVLTSFIVGTLLTQVASIISLVFISKLHTNKLLSILGADSMEALYDEKTIFKKHKDANITLEDTPFYSGNVVESSPHFLSDPALNNETSGKKRKKGLFRRKRSLYKDTMQSKEKKIRPFSYLIILLSLIPAIIFLLYISAAETNNDYFYWIIASIFMGGFAGLIILFIGAPLLLVFGIIRFVALEKPSRFAKFSKKISKIFLKRDSNLVALNMVRKKQYITTMFLVGVFISVLVFSNVTLNSIIRYDRVNTNIASGADLNLELPGSLLFNYDSADTFLEKDSPIQSGDDFTSFENALKNLNNSENESFINDVLTVQRKNTYGGYLEDQRYFLNLSKYLNIISEDHKDAISKDHFKKIQQTLDYNDNPDNSDLGIIVNPTFLEQNSVDVGESMLMDLDYYNPEDEDFVHERISVNIVAVSDLFPGILYRPDYFYYSTDQCILIDIDSLNLSSNIIYGSQVFQMIDLNYEIALNSTYIENQIWNVALDYDIPIGEFKYYDNSWDSVSLKNLDLANLSEVSGVYSIFYLDLIIIGIIIAIGIAILLVFLRKADKYNQGVLLARGYGKKGVLKLLLTEIAIVFSISIVSGLFSGGLQSVLLLQFYKIVSFNFNDIRLPIFFNPLDLLLLGLLIPILSIAIYLLVYYFETKKNYTDYFHQF